MSIKTTVFLKSFRRYFYLHRDMITDLLIIGLIGLLSVSWFRGDYLIAAVDFSMPLDRIRSFSANFYMWDSRSLGSANPRILALTFPVWAYFAFSEIIGLSLINAEKILFYFVFAISGLSMYYLTTTLVGYRANKLRRLAGLVSGIFYMLNPYVAINIMPLRQTSYIIYALLPLILGMFAKGLNERRNLRFAIVTAFVMSLATSVYVDPSFILLTFLPLFLFLIFFILTNHKRFVVLQALKFTATFMTIWILINIYWLLPNAYLASSELRKVTAAYGSLGITFQSLVQLNSASILGGLRLLGYWGLYSSYKGDPYFVWASAYQTASLTAIGFLIPILAFIPLLLKPKDKHVLFFTSFALVSLLLVNGSYSPLGQWLFSYIPLFEVFFNTPYLRFGMYVTLAYAFLIGYTLAEFHNRFTSSHLKKARCLVRQIISGISIVFILFLIVGVYAFPIWTGDVIYPGNEIIPSDRYKMPTYYQEARDWLGNDTTDFNIIPLPISKIGYVSYKWEHGGYTGPDPTEWLFPKTVITSASAGNGIAGLTAELMIENSSTGTRKILALMNVKYILFHGDTNWPYIEGNQWWISSLPEQFRSILDSQEGLFLEKSFGKLDFYRNDYWRPMHIYAAPNALLAQGDLDEMIEVVGSNSNFTPDESVLFLSDQLTLEQYSFIAKLDNYDLKPNITVEKINPTKYVIHVDTSQPFFLVFSESYHKNWVAYTNGEQVPGERHFVANGYANAWFINKTGSYDIDLEFWPQKLFYIGSATSITALIICTLYISKNKMKTIYKRYIKKNKNQTSQTHAVKQQPKKASS